MILPASLALVAVAAGATAEAGWAASNEAQAEKSLVRLQTPDGAGIGVVVSADGFIVSLIDNAAEQSRIDAYFLGQRRPEAAKIVDTIAGRGLTLLKVERTGLTPGRLASAAPAGFDRVFPLGLDAQDSEGAWAQSTLADGPRSLKGPGDPAMDSVMFDACGRVVGLSAWRAVAPRRSGEPIADMFPLLRQHQVDATRLNTPCAATDFGLGPANRLRQAWPWAGLLGFAVFGLGVVALRRLKHLA